MALEKVRYKYRFKQERDLSYIFQLEWNPLRTKKERHRDDSTNASRLMELPHTTETPTSVLAYNHYLVAAKKLVSTKRRVCNNTRPGSSSQGRGVFSSMYSLKVPIPNRFQLESVDSSTSPHKAAISLIYCSSNWVGALATTLQGSTC